MSPILDSIGSVKAFGWGALAGTNPVGSYDSLAVVTVGSGGASSITFAGIPQAGYQHLQIRAIARTTRSGFNFEQLRMQINLDTTTNYNSHALQGTGSAASAFSNGDLAYIDFYGAPASTTANIFSSYIFNFLDYTNINKYKTIRCLSGVDINGDGRIYLSSGTWRSTSSINTIKIYAPNSNIAQYSQFSLYGIRG